MPEALRTSNRDLDMVNLRNLGESIPGRGKSKWKGPFGRIRRLKGGHWGCRQRVRGSWAVGWRDRLPRDREALVGMLRVSSLSEREQTAIMQGEVLSGRSCGQHGSPVIHEGDGEQTDVKPCGRAAFGSEVRSFR